jgi:hypothetical protein
MIFTGMLLATATAFAQSAITGTCKEWFEPQTYQDAILAVDNPANHRPAVIFGKTVQVPAMRIRLLDGVSGRPFGNKGIRVVYGWRWLEYPYPEHGWGAWNETGDRLSCSFDEDGWFETSAHLIKPRGWYEGVYTRWPWPKRPEFNGLEVVVTTLLGGSARLAIKRRDLSRFEHADLVVRVFDDWRTETSWLSK